MSKFYELINRSKFYEHEKLMFLHYLFLTMKEIKLKKFNPLPVKVGFRCTLV